MGTSFVKCHMTRYVVPGEQAYRLNEMKIVKAVAQGERLVAIFHSHVRVGSYFSNEDVREALLDGEERNPGVDYVVFDAQDNMIVYRAENGGLTVHWAQADAAWKDWKSAHIDIPGVVLIAAGNPDRRLAATAAVVSFAAVTETAPGQRGFAILDFDILPRQ